MYVQLCVHIEFSDNKGCFVLRGPEHMLFQVYVISYNLVCDFSFTANRHRHPVTCIPANMPVIATSLYTMAIDNVNTYTHAN